LQIRQIFVEKKCLEAVGILLTPYAILDANAQGWESTALGACTAARRSYSMAGRFTLRFL